MLLVNRLAKGKSVVPMGAVVFAVIVPTRRCVMRKAYVWIFVHRSVMANSAGPMGAAGHVVNVPRAFHAAKMGFAMSLSASPIAPAIYAALPVAVVIAAYVRNLKSVGFTKYAVEVFAAV